MAAAKAAGKGDVFYSKMMGFVALDWSDHDTHQRAQKNLRRLKRLRAAQSNARGDIEFYELEECLSDMMRRWSFYWDGFSAVNNGDNTFRLVTSLIDDVFVNRRRVICVLQAKTMYDIYGKAILAAFAAAKGGLVVTREEKRSGREA